MMGPSLHKLGELSKLFIDDNYCIQKKIGDLHLLLPKGNRDTGVAICNALELKAIFPCNSQKHSHGQTLPSRNNTLF
jgi:hypothetical protein